MATKPTHSITAQIGDAHQILTNSLTVAEILELVSGFGYNADQLNAGLALVPHALRAVPHVRCTLC